MHRVVAIVEVTEKLWQIRVIHRFTGIVSHEVLLGNIRYIIALIVLRQKMVKWLFFLRPTVFRDGFVPLVRIREHCVNIKDNTAKRMLAVTDNLAQCVFRTRFEHNKTPCNWY